MNKKFLKKTVAVTTTVTTTIALSGVSLFAPVFVAVAAADIVDGDIMKTADNPDVYIAKHVGDNKYKRLILNPEVFESYDHLEWDNIETVTQAEMDVYTTSELVRAVGDPKVYKLTPDGDIGTRQWVNMTSAEFVSEGYDWNSIYEINTVDRNNYTLGADVAPGGVTVAPVDGGVALSLASDSPAAAGVAKGAANVTFSKVSFTGGSSSETITSITVTRAGLAADSDIIDVKIWDGATQLDSTQAINTTTHKAVFTGMSWVVPAGFTKVLTITASIASEDGVIPGVGNGPTFGIAAAADVVGASSVSGTFPVYGNPMTIAGVSVGKLDVTARSTPGNNNPISGSTDQEIASWTFAAIDEGMSVRSIKLTQIGTAANDDISNMRLKISGVQIGSTVEALATDGTVSFDLSGDPIDINANSSKIVYVSADMASGITTLRNVNFEVTNATDVVGFGSNSGGSVTITYNSGTAGQAFASQPGANAQIISQGGMPTVAVNSATNPSSQTFVVGTSQQLMSAFRFSAGTGEDYAITRIKIGLGDSATGTPDITSADLSNVTLYTYDVTTDIETQVGSATGFVGSTATYGANTSALDPALFEIPSAGNVVLHVRADIPSGAAWTGTELGVFLSEARVDGLSSKADIGAMVVTSVALANVTKHARTGTGTLLMVISPSTPAAENIVPGKDNHEFLKVDFTALSENITLTSLTVNLCDGAGCAAANAAGNATSGDFSNVKLMHGTAQLGSTAGTPTSTAGFSFNLIIEKDETVSLVVTANVPTDAEAASGWDANTARFAVDKVVVATGVSSEAAMGDMSTDAIGSLMTATPESLSVAFQALPAATVVVNSSNVVISKPVFTAGTSGDVRISSLKFSLDNRTELDTTSAADTSLGSLSLYDGGSSPIKTATFIDGTPDTVLFAGLNILVPKGTQKVLEVRATALATGTFYVGFADLESAANDVVGTGSVSLTSIYGSGTDEDNSGLLTIAGTGTLVIAVDAGTPAAALVAVGGTGKSGVEFSKFKFTAANEAVNVESVIVTLPVEDNTGAVNDVTNFDQLSLVNGVSSATVYPTGTNVGGAKTFTFTFDPVLVVPKDGSVVLTLVGEMNGTSATGAQSGSTPMFTIVASAITAKGADSGLAVTVSSTAVTGINAMTIVKTKPTFAISSTSPSGALIAGVTEVIRFTITADGGEDVVFGGGNHRMRFTVASSLANTAASTANLYDASTDAIIAPELTIAGSGNADGIKNGALLNFVPTVTIAAGESKEMYVKADITGYAAEGEFFRLLLGKTALDLVWGDGVSTDLSSVLTPGLPITGGTLTRT